MVEVLRSGTSVVVDGDLHFSGGLQYRIQMIRDEWIYGAALLH